VSNDVQRVRWRSDNAGLYEHRVGVHVTARGART
jgi:hypothetical protein